MKRQEFTEEFRREVVRLVETSGLTLKQVSQDLAIVLDLYSRRIVALSAVKPLAG